MTLKANNSVTEISPAPGSSQADSWDQAVIKVNGKVVQRGAAIVLNAGEANILLVEAPPSLAKMLRLEIIGGTVINVEPGEHWVPPVENKFEYTLTPQSNNNAQSELILFSREVPSVCTLDGRVVASEPLYDVFIDGELHPLGTDVYPVRDQVMEIKLIPTEDWGPLPVSMMLPAGYKGTHESEPLVGTPVMVGPEGHAWKLTLSGTDAVFSLRFDAIVPISLRILLGYHDSSITLTPITKAPFHPFWMLEVFAKRNGDEEVSTVRVKWRHNGDPISGTYTDAIGRSTTIAGRGPGNYSAELSIKDNPHSVQNITIE